MQTSIFFHWLLLVSFHVTVVTSHSVRSYQNIPQRPISFLPPSRHPILAFPTDGGADTSIRGTIDIPYRGIAKPIPVNFTLSSKVCSTLKPVLPHIIEDLSQLLLLEHFDGIAFPSSEDLQKSSLPVYLGANITHQFYRSKFMLAFSLKVSPLESDLKEIGASMWQSIISSLEVSARALERQARESDNGGLGSVLVIEAEMEHVHVLAGWRLWRIVDGIPTICAD